MTTSATNHKITANRARLGESALAKRLHSGAAPGVSPRKVMRKHLLIVVLLLAGCDTGRLAQVGSGVRADKDHVSFGALYVGVERSETVRLTNDARGSLEVDIAATAPFTAPLHATLGGGDALDVEVHFRAGAPGAFSGTLTITAGEQVLELPIDAEAQATPTCPAPSPCHVVEFDTSSGACAERAEADGVACGADNLCLINATCQVGECVGTARDCDDRNACTRDSCAPAVGCLREDVSASCPGAPVESCQVPRCDPLTGCALSPAADGTPCGENDCTTARVCIAGACVKRAAPEGSTCAPATPCRDSGYCREQACVTPRERAMQPLWTWRPAADRSFNFQGVADFSGNVYFSDGLTMGGDVNIVSLNVDGFLRFRVPITGTRSWYSVGIAVDDAAQRIFVSSRAKAIALSSIDGRLLWETDLSVGVPVRDPQSNGQPSFWSNTEGLVGSDLVVYQLMEGSTDHWAYLVALDRNTGAERWRLPRKGHLYGVASTPTGELWFSHANCWALAGNVERVSPGGIPSAATFVEGLVMAVTGASTAVLLASPRGTLMSSAGQVPLTPPVGLQLGRSVAVAGSTLFFPSATGTPTVMTYDTASSQWAAFAQPTASSFDLQLTAPSGLVLVTHNGRLVQLDGQGKTTLDCPLPGTSSSSVTVVRERYVGRINDMIQAFEVKGVDAPRAGWPGAAGGITRDRRFH